MAAVIRRYTYAQACDGIQKTFFDHFSDPLVGWASVPGITVAPTIQWQNVQQRSAPSVAAPWMRFQIQHVDGEQDSFGLDGEGSFEARGFVTIQLFVPQDQNGLISARQLAKVLQRAFRGKTGVGEYCGIIFRNARINEVGPEDRWFQINVLANFEYDEER
jgi:hypothetical protein